MNESCNAAIVTGRKATLNTRQNKAQSTETIQVLSVGPLNRSSKIRDALREVPNSRLSIATNYRELWVIPQEEVIQVVILHDVLPSFELEAACRLIRRRWPYTRILILRSRTGCLRDALYDDRIVGAVAPQVLLATIRRLAGKQREKETGKVASHGCAGILDLE